MVPVLLSLLLVLGPAFPQETQDGELRQETTQDGLYSLTFVYSGVSTPKAGTPSFEVTGYLNDQAFLHYDSESKKAEPVGPWKQMEGMVNWQQESQLQRDRENIFMQSLKDIMDAYNDKGIHTFQGKLGCEIRNNNLCGAFWGYTYDGQSYIDFSTKVPAWLPRKTKAVFLKEKWETEGSVQQAKAYLEEECPQMLRRYLQYSRAILDRQEPPSVSVSSDVSSDGIRTLKCLASDFYPRPIVMTWTRAGKVMEPEPWQNSPIREDGTYQSLVLVKVPASDSGPYSCHVQHSSLAQPLVVPWDGKQ